MRSRSREINVFSMSALDLFASALGAFILMSIVLMPYFLRTDPDAVQKLHSALSQAKAEQAEAERKNERLQKELAELKNAPKFTFPDLDMVIALDTTGSMASAVEGLRQDIDQFAELMLKLAPSLGMGLIDFKDKCDPSTAVRQFSLRLMDSGGLSNLLSFSSSMQTTSGSCNPDKPEALAMALDSAIASNWRSESQVRMVVIITDNPAYPDRTASAIAAARAFAARGPQFRVSTVFTNTGASEPGTQEFLRELADSGNGNFTEAGRSFVVTMLFALAGL